jgi:hypothetical protein
VIKEGVKGVERVERVSWGKRGGGTRSIVVVGLVQRRYWRMHWFCFIRNTTLIGKKEDIWRWSAIRQAQYRPVCENADAMHRTPSVNLSPNAITVYLLARLELLLDA